MFRKEDYEAMMANSPRMRAIFERLAEQNGRTVGEEVEAMAEFWADVEALTRERGEVPPLPELLRLATQRKPQT